jgi:D-tyrosyl-tRNA(Tyr) deacylase
MRAIIQRVSEAFVDVDGQTVGRIGRGLVVLVGVGFGDTGQDADWMVEKIVNLRIFEREGRFDRSLLDIDGEMLAVSQFTLYGDCSRGRRPSFSAAMEPVAAKRLFEDFVEKAKKRLPKVETGIFQASMQVSLVNDGPVTLIIDSKG